MWWFFDPRRPAPGRCFPQRNTTHRSSSGSPGCRDSNFRRESSSRFPDKAQVPARPISKFAVSYRTLRRGGIRSEPRMPDSRISTIPWRSVMNIVSADCSTARDSFRRECSAVCCSCCRECTASVFRMVRTRVAPSSCDLATQFHVPPLMISVPFILLTEEADGKTGAELRHGGRWDCVAKSQLDGATLVRTIRNTLAVHSLQQEQQTAEHSLRKLSRAVEQSADTIFITDLHGIVEIRESGIRGSDRIPPRRSVR